ncbi:ribonuclease H2, subunit B [Pseudoneurospora amorphoporcata]|uniref:Ribonuclease H2 subunit B n=1 Tax=Pseudoneurospora amorphoporcata TaxID=241081 RepID=A0AAN6NX61_9PEZI|nr:ribonuclease H2, subunit B [Pseudoneurospora amorphoporcata]
MPRTTRSSKAAATASAEKTKSTTSSNTSSIYTLAPELDSPPNVFILPKSATPESRIITLQNPRYAKPTRYLVCPSTGFYEFTKMAAPQNKSPRSWLIDGTPLAPAQTTKDSDLYVATPVDPLFLVLPALAAKITDKKRMFLSSDDHLDAVSEQGDYSDSGCRKENHLVEVLKWPSTRQLLEARMAAVCDTVEAGDETMFRLNESKLVEELLQKAKRMSSAEDGLPKSMEEKFVTKALEAPIVGIRSTAVSMTRSSTTVTVESAGSQEGEPEDMTKVTKTTTTTTSLSEATTAVATPNNEVLPSLTPTPEVLSLQRLRVSLNFLTSSYLPPSLSAHLKPSLFNPPSVDFAPLESYLLQLTKLRQEAVASRSHGDFSRKRIAGDEEDAFEKAEKRRKKEEEEKVKKAGVSRGVKELAKVNTRGMMKLTSFFQKKT